MTKQELLAKGYQIVMEHDGISTVISPEGEPGTFHWDGADSYTDFETYRDSCKFAGIEPEVPCREKPAKKVRANGGRRSTLVGRA